MQKISFEKKRPGDCSRAELMAFRNLVLRGGQVNGEGLSKLIEEAVCLGFGRIDNDIVSIAAIKLPRENYRDRVFQNAGSPERAPQFRQEFGWAFTRPKFEGRGLSSALAEVLLERFEEPIFATTGTHNQVMIHILKKRQFSHLGKPYSGRTESKVLYVRA